MPFVHLNVHSHYSLMRGTAGAGRALPHPHAAALRRGLHPVENAPRFRRKDSPKDVRIVQWEKDQTEDAGLVKIDLLGNRSLAVIRDALAPVRRNTGRVIAYDLFNPL